MMKRRVGIAILIASVLVLVLTVGVGSAFAATAKTPASAAPPVTTGASDLQSLKLNPDVATCLPLTGPFMGVRNVLNFQNDASGDAPDPYYFAGGEIYGLEGIYAVWGTGMYVWHANWTPNVQGKHVALAWNGYGLIEFNRPQAAVCASVEPDQWGWRPVAIAAWDDNENLIGLYVRWIFVSDYLPSGNWLGLYSTRDNIRYVQFFTDPDANGVAFSDLSYRTSVGTGWKFWH
jgi:hypothetical protein